MFQPQDLRAADGDVGHSNNKQKIQYTMRLKHELEERRGEVLALLRERFLLEQCVRFQVWATS